jgi:hypothetical protein
MIQYSFCKSLTLSMGFLGSEADRRAMEQLMDNLVGEQPGQV